MGFNYNQLDNTMYNYCIVLYNGVVPITIIKFYKKIEYRH